MAAVCAFFKTGYCKFRENCRKRHVQDTCILTGCDGTCDERHPRICRYHSLYGTCKFNSHCAYLHKRPYDSEIEDLRRKLNAVQQEVVILVKLIEDLQTKSSQMIESKSSEYSTSSYQNISTPPVIPQIDGNVTTQDDDTSPTPPSFECEICDLDFPTTDSYNEHNAYGYCCTICGIYFSTERDGNCHEEELHPEYPGIQPRCYEFKT